MRIKDLPQDFKEMAIENTNYPTPNSLLVKSFKWYGATKPLSLNDYETEFFWFTVNDGNFTKARQLLKK